MAIDRTKLAAWIGVIALVSAGYLWMHEEDAPRPEPPPITVNIPVPAPVIVPVPVEKVIAETKAPQPAPKPAAKPKAVEQKKSVRKPPLPRRQSPRCALVPPEAYRYPTGMVIAAAKDRGVTEAGMDNLKWCIGAVS